MAGDMKTEIPPVSARTPEEKRRAALAVAARSTDAEDCRELLAMLGLIPNPRKHPSPFDEFGVKRRSKRRPVVRDEPGTSGWRPA
jgi:hypothetical protein